MFNKKEFSAMRKELSDLDKRREEIIQLSRGIIQLSKRMIYATQRDDIATAKKVHKDIEAQVKLLRKKDVPLDTNIATTAYQEYVEAVVFFDVETAGKLTPKKKLNVTSEEYLLGLCDVTGELVRKAVNHVIHKRFKQAQKIEKLVQDIYGEFLQFNLRNGELRKKSDQIKWNLKKLEDVVYDISLKS